MALQIRRLTGKHPLSQELIRLRYSFRENQGQFAKRLGIAVGTLRHWETDRPPNDRALAQLEYVARALGRENAAESFRAAREKQECRDRAWRNRGG